MHAGDGDAVLQAHQLRQHFCALNDRDGLRVRRQDFRIVGAECGGGHDDVRAGDVGGGMAFENGGAQAEQAVGDRRPFQVGTGDAMAQIQQNLSDAAHADAANPYEMYVLRADEHPEWEPSFYCSSAGVVEKTAEAREFAESLSPIRQIAAGSQSFCWRPGVIISFK